MVCCHYGKSRVPCPGSALFKIPIVESSVNGNPAEPATTSLSRAAARPLVDRPAFTPFPDDLDPTTWTDPDRLHRIGRRRIDGTSDPISTALARRPLVASQHLHDLTTGATRRNSRSVSTDHRDGLVAIYSPLRSERACTPLTKGSMITRLRHGHLHTTTRSSPAEPVFAKNNRVDPRYEGSVDVRSAGLTCQQCPQRCAFPRPRTRRDAGDVLSRRRDVPATRAERRTSATGLDHSSIRSCADGAADDAPWTEPAPRPRVRGDGTRPIRAGPVVRPSAALESLGHSRRHLRYGNHRAIRPFH